MYIRLSMIFQLIFMSLSYFFIVISLWQVMGSYVLLFAVIPLMTNVLIFSHAFLNYSSILMFSFLAFYIIKVPFDFMFYEWKFWGVQGVLVMVTVLAAVMRRLLIPSLPSYQNSWMQKLILKSDRIVVQYDINKSTIIDINASACRLYGWTKKELLRHSLSIIHPINFLKNPPYEFMEKMRQGVSWHGFLPIINKSGSLFEERAVYKPIFDSYKRLVSIEKNVIEVIHQQNFQENHNLYQYFFSSLDRAAVLVDSCWNIENQNDLFTQKFSPYFSHVPKILLDIFPKEIQHKLVHSLKTAFDGSESSFVAQIDGYEFQMPVQFYFLPYRRQTKTSNKVAKVFIILDELWKNENSALLADDSKEIIDLSLFLKNVFVEIKDTYELESHIRLFSGELPTINISKDIWFSLFTNILLLAIRHATLNNPISVMMVCSTSFNIHFFKVKYQGVPFHTLSEYFKNVPDSKASSLEVRKIKDSLAYLGMEPVIIPRDHNTSILCFNFKES
ncbi:MAG: PAS domain S-box protein [Brevinema sp.]